MSSCGSTYSHLPIPVPAHLPLVGIRDAEFVSNQTVEATSAFRMLTDRGCRFSTFHTMSTMSLEAARDLSFKDLLFVLNDKLNKPNLEWARGLSIQDFLHVFNEKLDFEWARIRDIPACGPVPGPAVSLESEVSTHRPVLTPADVAVSDPGGLPRLTVLKPLHTTF